MLFHRLYVLAIQLYHRRFGYCGQGNGVSQYNQLDFSEFLNLQTLNEFENFQT